MLDLLVVGAGPHALSLVTRLVDDTPDLLTEDERVRMMSHGMKGKNAAALQRSHAVVREHLKKRYDGAAKLRERVLVIDLHGRWMSQWERDFASLQIPHTRSHVNLHPCPYDYQSLEVWARWQNRDSELWHMEQMDRKASNTRGYKGPFLLPGTALFNDFCRSLVDRYGIESLVRQGSVEDIRIVESPTKAAPCTFEVRLADGSFIATRRVVCAMGPGPVFRGMDARLPWWADELAASLDTAGHAHSCRLMHFVKLVPWLHDGGAAQLQGRRVLVVGGGQSAAHLALLAAHKGAAVTMAARRRLVQKPFDIDLELIGTWRGEFLQKFWNMNMEERVKYMRCVRDGGSISPEVYHALKEHVERQAARDKTIASLKKQKRNLFANYLVLETVQNMFAGAAGDALSKDPAVDLPGTREPDFAKLHSLMGRVVVPTELKEAYQHVRAMLHQASSIELIDKNTVRLALQKLVTSIAKVLGEIESAMSNLETKKKEMGGLELLEEVEVTSATWCSDSPAVSGRVETNTHRDSQRDPLDAHVAARSENDGEIVARFSSGDFRVYDFVWLATGGELDMNLVPVMASLQAQRPIPTAGGLPKLQTDLSWDVGTCQHHAHTQLHVQITRTCARTKTHTHVRTHVHAHARTHAHTHVHTPTHTHTSDCPLHVMGAFAQLELGPDALNLAGARSGSVLVARAILDRPSSSHTSSLKNSPKIRRFRRVVRPSGEERRAALAPHAAESAAAAAE